jgi:hypothetical protein
MRMSLSYQVPAKKKNLGSNQDLDVSDHVSGESGRDGGGLAVHPAGLRNSSRLLVEHVVAPHGATLF